MTDDLEAVGYDTFCGSIPYEVDAERVDVRVLKEAMGKGGVVIDVRNEVEFGICSLPGSISECWSECSLQCALAYENLDFRSTVG